MGGNPLLESLSTVVLNRDLGEQDVQGKKTARQLLITLKVQTIREIGTIN